MAAMYEATADVESAVRSCGSARLLSSAGYGGDVHLASELDCDQTVPVVIDGAFSPS